MTSGNEKIFNDFEYVTLSISSKVIFSAQMFAKTGSNHGPKIFNGWREGVSMRRKKVFVSVAVVRYEAKAPQNFGRRFVKTSAYLFQVTVSSFPASFLDI